MRKPLSDVNSELPEFNPEDSRRDEMVRQAFGEFRVRRIEALHNDRNLMELFLIVFAGYAGVRLFFDPPTLAHHVSPYWRYGWRLLLIGCAASITLGLIWTGRAITAFSLMQLGYIGLGFGALAYGVATRDLVVLIFGFAALGRFIQLDLYMTSVNPEYGFIKSSLAIHRRRRDKS